MQHARDHRRRNRFPRAHVRCTTAFAPTLGSACRNSSKTVATEDDGWPCRPSISRAHERHVHVTECRQELAHRVRGDEAARRPGSRARHATPGRSAAFRPAITDDSCPLSASGLMTSRTAVPRLVYFRSQRRHLGPADDDDVGDPALEERLASWRDEGRPAGPRTGAEPWSGPCDSTGLRRESRPESRRILPMHAFLDFHGRTPYTGRVFKLSVCWGPQRGAGLAR